MLSPKTSSALAPTARALTLSSTTPSRCCRSCRPSSARARKRMPPSLTPSPASMPSPADMAFHFTLEAVLRLRQSLEDRELLRLQALLAKKATLLKELGEYRQLSVRVQEKTSQAMLKPIPAVELHF